MTLESLTSDAFGAIRHGFFTRHGGASCGIYASLNCGSGSSDENDVVAENRSRVAKAMGVAPDKLLSLYQIHSPDVVVASADGWTEHPRADAIVTGEPGIALAILTADCAPVLFADAQNRVIGAAHAGWRGALAGILDETIDAMIRLGAERARIVAVAGPTISQQNYEVGQEFFETFLDEGPHNSRFFVNGTSPDKYRFDLPGFVLWRLREAGIDSASWIGICTYADPERFFSFRRSTHRREPDYGRLISAIAL